MDGAFQNVIHKSTDEVHLLTVLPPLGLTSAYPMAPVASAAAVTAVQHSLAAQKWVGVPGLGLWHRVKPRDWGSI